MPDIWQSLLVDFREGCTYSAKFQIDLIQNSRLSAIIYFDSFIMAESQHDVCFCSSGQRPADDRTVAGISVLASAGAEKYVGRSSYGSRIGFVTILLFIEKHLPTSCWTLHSTSSWQQVLTQRGRHAKPCWISHTIRLLGQGGRFRYWIYSLVFQKMSF